MSTATSPFKMKATSGGGDYEVPPAGNWPAVLVAMIDLGTQEEEYQGERKKSRKVFLAWEVLTTADDDTEKRFVVGRDYTLSLGERANLRAIVSKLRGKEVQADEEYDITLVLGKPCLLELVHKTSSGSGNTYAKIDKVSSLPKGMVKVQPEHKPFAWMIGSGPVPSQDWLPRVYGEKVSDVIDRSDEMKGRPAKEGAEDFPHGANAPAGSSEDF